MLYFYGVEVGIAVDEAVDDDASRKEVVENK